MDGFLRCFTPPRGRSGVLWGVCPFVCTMEGYRDVQRGAGSTLLSPYDTLYKATKNLIGMGMYAIETISFFFSFSLYVLFFSYSLFLSFFVSSLLISLFCIVLLLLVYEWRKWVYDLYTGFI